ncbi:putative protein kinase [Plasmopara halstedii]
MQRRFSFTCQATNAIDEGTHDIIKHDNCENVIRKASSFPSLIAVDSILGIRGSSGEDFRKNKQVAHTSETISVQSDAALFVLGSKKRENHDGAHFLFDCLNNRFSAHLSARLPSNSLMLRQESPLAESNTVQSPPSFDDQSEISKIGRELKQISPFLSQFSFKSSPSKVQNAKDIVDDGENDFPDWLLDKGSLSPDFSAIKSPKQSPRHIDDEIRFAVDSAAARVNEELGRHEQFKCDLLSAATTSALPASTDIRSAISKLFLKGGSDFEKNSLSDTELSRSKDQLEVKTRADHGVTDETEHGNLLLLMEVIIGDGRTETIEIHEGDDPDTLAFAFATMHALQPDALSKLRALIQDQLNALAEKEPENVVSPGQPVQDDWAIDLEFDEFVAEATPVDTRVSDVNVSMNNTPSFQPEHQKRERETQREVNYNSLKARYGHCSQVNDKSDFERQNLVDDILESHAEYVPNINNLSMPMPSTVPRFTTTICYSRNSSTKKRSNLGVIPAYERLHALAESKNKWIQRAKNAKELEQAREEQQSHRFELMAAKSRDLVANRTNGGYANIGERLHEEALSDIAKKMQRHERRILERDGQHDWMCPKCAFVNRFVDSFCQNMIASARQQLENRRNKSVGCDQTANNVNRSFHRLNSHPGNLCGQPKPEKLFQPTLLTSASGATKSHTTNKENSSQMVVLRRQRFEKVIAEEFQQSCPFKPKINKVSEEIMREKLESVAEISKVCGKTKRSRNPHLDLYENSFQARALRNEREKEYLKQFSFKPNIGVNALWVAPDKSQSDFVERLAVGKFQELERKRVALHEKYAQDRDPLTGKEFFKPEIGRAPAFARNKQGLPIGEFLYGAHLEQQEYHRELRKKKQRDIDIKSQQTFVSEVSRQALERRKSETCSRFFNALLALTHQAAPTSLSTDVLSIDNTEEEVNDMVIPAKVNLSALPPEIARVVAIVFEYANHGPISRDAFSGYMDRLVCKVPGISYSQIIFLANQFDTEKDDRHLQRLDSDREAAERKELTFHPVINKNSREIATKHGRVPSSKVFQALNQYFDHYLERKEQRLKQQQHEFKKSHPFHPTLVTKLQSRDPAAAAFYDKICSGCKENGNKELVEVPGSQFLTSTSYLIQNAVKSPIAQLRTACVSARPYVRPITSERSRPNTSESVVDDHIHELLKFNELSMRSIEMVHPVSGTTMATLPHNTMLVLYSLVGEEFEQVQDSKPHHGPDTNWNAFVLPLPPAGGRVRLADVQTAFPLGSNFHFAFRCKDGAYLDLTNPESAIPFCGRKILARVTPLDDDPRVEYLHYEEPREALPTIETIQISKITKSRAESYGSSTTECRHRDEYEELESTTYESQDEELPISGVRSPSRGKMREKEAENGWKNSSYQSGDDGYNNVANDNRRSHFSRDGVYDSSGSLGLRQSSEWAEAGKDAQNYLRKQTEQAYDFAKKISIEDAKKGATETAKKAKKWGGSLLTSISASISNASANVSKSETIQVGGVTVQVARLLAEGAYAQVLLVRSSATNETFALKRIICQSQDVENDVQMELQVFHSVKHLNIMPLVEFSEARVQQGMEFYFLVPYFERGSLWDAIDAARQSSSPLWPFTQRTALHLFHGICSGVLSLHRAGFCHRDLKPHNILLSSSSDGENFLAYIPVVTDFGSCAPIHVEVTSRRNSLELHDEANRKSSAPYRAPELFEPTVDVALDGQSDVWSLGCVLYAMAFGTSPFEHPREGFMKLACLNGRVSFPPEQGGVVLHRGTQFSVEFCDFIRDMLQVNPEERPSVLDALEFTEELLNDEVQR